MPRKKRRQQPTTPTEAPTTPSWPQCEVVGCEHPMLEIHAGPSGPVYLCGRCGMIARRNLREEADREALAEAMARPFMRTAALRQRQRAGSSAR